MALPLRAMPVLPFVMGLRRLDGPPRFPFPVELMPSALVHVTRLDSGACS